ncbi:MAG: hypothetical protein A2845_05885 [Candidatus Lloydbacteria bacterium RIFCSPHIGHO2_01_FULL_49_22]|uniref:Uncharacterized protein n=1 Tax=Candidatus Lloydbacteria bacterium RIFCSPHIGHO2_01_FULL_49_22 TaxID=1798658 RepID=A0A1G2CVS8_9BACT|nr:MAG: hypothetical protein A2845_05885 [Candidatus Lloydbacteria bacterium RIFCSPHIGHO2_01_FULL_49_22]OGZ09790.1 MAG: hypothetical protein A3C14_00130 [Candidatus Lloydbacteria bacterium RIFCSPHIGHO2_02_FULL_50_18]
MTLLTGEQLFLRYAYVCTDDRFSRGLIKEEHVATLQKLIEENGDPEQALLMECFADATRGLFAFAGQQGKSPWTKETITLFWRHHHGHEGDCRVLHGVVLVACSQKKIAVRVYGADAKESSDYFALNHYGLSLSAGDRVTLHRRVIIEHVV